MCSSRTCLRLAFGLSLLLAAAGLGGCPQTGSGNLNTNGTSATAKLGTAVVLGYNDLGMHCMNQDFSELMILPPYNTLHAQVIARGGEPRILTSGVTIEYAVQGNTHSADKTNFWQYAPALLGVSPPDNVGLAGNGLTGTMSPTGKNDWSAIGIPVTPIDDNGNENPYPLAKVTVTQNGTVVAETMAVTPVSWEISCDLCHNTAGISTATDILRKHDQLHGTSLESRKPVLCSECHADVALSQPGAAGLPSLSRAMHGSHAARISQVSLTVDCYACHPGQRTQCLRDVHYSAGMTCYDCHESMTAVASVNRRPWVDEPRCGDCHAVAGHQYEQSATLFRDSVGHGNVHCAACHGSPHAIGPTVVAADNVQPITLQGHAGVINTCQVCHTRTPDEGFFHRAGGGD